MPDEDAERKPLSALEDLEDELRAFESSIGLPAGFIQALAAEDDWSFVIKAHALLEAGVSQLLAREIGRAELDKLIASLPMGGRHGKIALAKALRVIDATTSRFIDALSEIRNDFVHEIANAGTHLTKYFADLDPNEVKRMHSALDLLLAKRRTVRINDEEVSVDDVFRQNPKELLGLSLGLILSSIYKRSRVALTASRIRTSGDRLFTEMFFAYLQEKKTHGADS